MGLKGSGLVFGDADVKLGRVVSAAEQEILEDEGLGEAGTFGEEAPSHRVGGPGGTHPVSARRGAPLRKARCDAPKSSGHATEGLC